MAKITRRAALGTIAGASVVLGAPSIRRVTAQGAPLKIGHIGPMSGPAGSMGQRSTIGLEFAVNEINKKGGILGRPVEILHRDDKASPAEAGLATRDLMGQGAKIILGGWLTGPANGTLPVIDSENGLFIILGASLPGFTRELFNKRAFRLVFDSVMYQNGRAISLARKYPNVRSWSVIMPDQDFALTAFKVFEAAMKKHFPNGSTLKFHEPVLHKAGATDYRVQIARLAEQRAEGLLTMNIGADTVAFFSQAKPTPLLKQYKVMTENGFGEWIGDMLGANLPDENLWSFQQWLVQAKESTDVAREFHKQWVAKEKNNRSDGLAAGGYTGLYSIYHAANAAKSVDVDALIPALETIRFESVFGPAFGYRKEDHQGLMDTCNFKFAKKAEPPGWEVVEYDIVKAAETMGPPTPGVKYEMPT